MKKLFLTMFFSMFLFATANAGSYGIGVSGTIANISASGTESEGKSGSETENSVMSATAGNNVMYGEVYAEYNIGDNEGFTLGVAYIPGEADINSKTLSRTDASQGSYVAQDTGTVKANAAISDHITYYAEMMMMNGFYAKLGYAQVDINVNQTNDSGYGVYPDKTLDALIYGLGYKGDFGNNGVVKLEGFYADYDSYSATSNAASDASTVSADLDVVGAKLSLGYKF